MQSYRKLYLKYSDPEKTGTKNILMCSKSPNSKQSRLMSLLLQTKFRALSHSANGCICFHYWLATLTLQLQCKTKNTNFRQQLRTHLQYF